MKQFIEFIPVIPFVAVYFYTHNIYPATMVLMAGCVLQVAFEFATTRRIGKKTQVIFLVVMILGGATLFFRNNTFLFWKPTVINWLFAGTLLGSQLIGRENMIKKMLGEQLDLPDQVWRNLDLGWALGFFLAGALNLVVAYNFTLDFWVGYKLVGGISITMLYSVITVIYLARGGFLNEDASKPEPHDTADIKQ